MKSTHFWQNLLERLQQGRAAVLLVVTENSGATPGKPGFVMAAFDDGRLQGSIGGGKIEFDLVEEARQMLRQEGAGPLLRRLRLTDDGAPASNGMICGGEQCVLLYPCRIADQTVITRITAALAAGTAGGWSITSAGMAWHEATAAAGPAGASKAPDAPGTGGALPAPDALNGPSPGPLGIQTYYFQQILPRDTLFIIGGGHVSLALAHLMSLLEWRIVVLDDRPDVETLKNNHWADAKIITSFDDVARHIPPGDGSWVVIMTPSHRADEAVLRQLVARPLRYLGMMASRHKAAGIMDQLRRDGVGEELLRRVCAPVGLPISSHTPAEIAVSIAAQLIQVHNQEEPTGVK